MLTSAQVTAFFAARLGGSHWNSSTELQQSAALLSAEEQIADSFTLVTGYETDPRYLRAVSLLASYLLKPAASATFNSIKVGPIEIKPNEPVSAESAPDLFILLGGLIEPALNRFRWDFR